MLFSSSGAGRQTPETPDTVTGSEPQHPVLLGGQPQAQPAQQALAGRELEAMGRVKACGGPGSPVGGTHGGTQVAATQCHAVDKNPGHVCVYGLQVSSLLLCRPLQLISLGALGTRPQLAGVQPGLVAGGAGGRSRACLPGASSVVL